MRYDDLTVAIEVMERIKATDEGRGGRLSDWQAIARDYDAHLANGITSQCIVFPRHSFVLKWEHWGLSEKSAPEKSLGPILSVAPEDAAFFPITIVDGPFIIQERVHMYVERIHGMSDHAKLAYELAIARMGIKYNIGDLHAHNIGMRVSDNHPVIFDVGLRSTPMLSAKAYISRQREITDDDIRTLINNTHMWSSDAHVDEMVKILRPEIPALIA